MRKYIIEEKKYVPPFNDLARNLQVLNKPLWLAQRDALAPYCDNEFAIAALEGVPDDPEPMVVYRDNLYFDEPYIQEFFRLAMANGTPCRAAFAEDDHAFMTYVKPLARNITEQYDASIGKKIYLLDLWYFPRGYHPYPVPIIVGSDYEGVGYYSVPSYMSNQDTGDLEHYLTKRTVVSVENWIHVFFANIVMGIFSLGHRFEHKLDRSNLFRLKILWKSLLEQKQTLSCSELVHIGKNTIIDPSAIIQGPTWIGDNCTIGPGVVIGNCYIGDQVNIAQGCNLMLSVVGNGSFLPFRAALFMSAIMENAIVAQNTCLQMCVIGKDSFIGAGSTFTDFNLLPSPLRVETADGQLETIDQVVLGGCVGHNCRIGSGLVIYPARSIESDVVLFASPTRRVIRKNISYEESDHHDLRSSVANLHVPQYQHREGEPGSEATYLETW